MIRQMMVLTRFHLRDELRSGELLLVVVPFAAVALLIVPMAVGVEPALLQRLGPAFFWIVVVLFAGVAVHRSPADLPGPVGDLMRLSGVDAAARFVSASVASAVGLLAFEIVVGAVMALLYDPRLAGWAWMAVVLPLVALGLAMIGTIAARVVGAERRSSLASLLIVPVAVPLLLGAAQSTEGLRVGAGILRWILLLAIVDVVLALVGVLTARPLEEA